MPDEDYSEMWALVKVKASDFLNADIPYPIQAPDGREYFVSFYRASDGSRIDDVTEGGRSALDNTVEGDLSRIREQGDGYIYINLPYSIIQGQLYDTIKSDSNEVFIPMIKLLSDTVKNTTV